MPEPIGGHVSEGERLELLTLLIEGFEGRQYKLKLAAAQEAGLELLRANGLKQKDLVEVFGTASIVSEVLSGKRFPVNPRRIASDKVEFSLCSSVPTHTQPGVAVLLGRSVVRLRSPQVLRPYMA